MTEATIQKRKPGRPAKVREPQTGPVPQDDVEAIIAQAEDPPDAAIMQQVAILPQREMPGLPFTSEIRARILACNEIKIVCKTVDHKGITLDHSRHDAEWLKEFV